jgi:hypothetical protein
VDPSVPTVLFESLEGKPVATYVNFAMHADTTGGPRISADYPGALSRVLAAVKGPEMLTVFTIGTAGDVNHLKVAWAGPQTSPAEAQRLGTILAGAVLRAYTDLAPVPDGAIRVRREVVGLPLAEIRPGDLDRARAVKARIGGKDEPTFLETVDAYKVLDVEARRGKPIQVEVQVIAVGDRVAWVSLPGEVFVELGLAIKAASPFPVTAIAELANGAIGYIPTRQAWPQGNYEVISARCGPGSGEILVETAVRLLREIRTEAVADSPPPAAGAGPGR